MPDFLKIESCFCCYCGDFATECDHVIPVSWYQRTLKRRRTSKRKDEVVLSCSSCNQIIKNNLVCSLGTRAAFVAERLAIVLRKWLSSPHWDTSEMDELEGRILRKVSAMQMKKSLIINRIRHCNIIAKLEPTIEEFWESYKAKVSLVEYLTQMKTKIS